MAKEYEKEKQVKEQEAKEKKEYDNHTPADVINDLLPFLKKYKN